MASILDTITKRRKLKPRSYPYWERVSKGRFIGLYVYKNKTKTDIEGTWRARKEKNGKYIFEALGGEIDSDYADMLKAAQGWFEEATEADIQHYTIDQCIDDYIDNRTIEKGDLSAAGAKQNLKKHLSPALGKKVLSKLTTLHLKKWRDSLLDEPEDKERKPITKSTANRILSDAMAAFNYSYRNGVVDSKTAWERVQKFKKADNSRTLFLTDEQVKSLLQHTKGGLHTLVHAAMLTGARYGELTALKTGDFDANNGTLNIGSGKTGSRVCYLSDKAVKFFKDVTTDRLPKSFLLVKDGGDNWGKNHHVRKLKDGIKAAKLPKDTVFYSLRHYHISKALLSGVQVQVIAENCGTSIRMVEKHYGKFMATDRRAMMNMVDLAHE